MRHAALALLLASSLFACASRDPEPASSAGAASSSGDDTTTSGGASDTSPTAADTTSSGPQIVVSHDACTTDADCVPAGCCHAAACVAVANAPACGDAICTEECRYGTLDCGGGCLCQAGHCAARLSPRPNIPGVTDVQ